MCYSVLHSEFNLLKTMSMQTQNKETAKLLHFNECCNRPLLSGQLQHLTFVYSSINCVYNHYSITVYAFFKINCFPKHC